MQSRKVLKLLLILGLLIILLAVALLLLSRKPMGLVQRLYIRLTKYRKLLPYVVAQAKFETTNFTSLAYREEKNMFGMKHPIHRPALGVAGGVHDTGKDRGVMQKYTSTLQSLRDFFLWLDYTKFPVEVGGVEQYTTELQERGYFTVGWDVYTSGLKKYLK
jgi:hypothetical protein